MSAASTVRCSTNWAIAGISFMTCYFLMKNTQNFAPCCQDATQFHAIIMFRALLGYEDSDTGMNAWRRKSHYIEIINEPGRTRTCNPRLRRPMPYPLGHGSMQNHLKEDILTSMPIHETSVWINPPLHNSAFKTTIMTSNLPLNTWNAIFAICDAQVLLSFNGITNPFCAIQNISAAIASGPLHHHWSHCLHRLVVRTSRCGRDNPGSTPGVDILFQPIHCKVLSRFVIPNRTWVDALMVS